MPLASIPSIPPEICDVILDFLWDDPQSLAACSFVSRTWLPTARLHKFRSVALHSAWDCMRLKRVLDVPLLESSDIALCVGELWTGIDSNEVSIGGPDIEAFWKDQRLASLLFRFAKVYSLRLENLVWKPRLLPSITSDAILSFSTHLTDLHLCRIVFEESDGIIRLISAYPALARLKMSYMSWTSRSRTVAAAAAAQAKSPLVHWRFRELTTDPTSYLAFVSAMSLYHTRVRMSMTSLEWATFEQPQSVWLRMQVFLESEAMMQRVLTRIGAIEGDALIDMVPDEPIASTIGLLHINVSRPVSNMAEHAWAASMPGYLQNVDVRRIEFNLGTSLSHSIFLDWLNFPLIDHILALLASNHREMVIVFCMRIQLVNDNMWWADVEEVKDAVARKLSVRLKRLSSLGTPVGLTLSFFYPDHLLDVVPVTREVWWT